MFLLRIKKQISPIRNRESRFKFKFGYEKSPPFRGGDLGVVEKTRQLLNL